MVYLGTEELKNYCHILDQELTKVISQKIKISEAHNSKTEIFYKSWTFERGATIWKRWIEAVEILTRKYSLNKLLTKF